MTEETKTMADLRDRLHASEYQQIELVSARDQASYDALVVGDAKARKRLDAVNAELTRVSNEIAAIHAALSESARRDMAVEKAELAEKQRQNASQAEAMMAEVEQIAIGIDTAMGAIRKGHADIEIRMRKIRQLIGAGPDQFGVRTRLGRAFKSGLGSLPQHQDVLAPNERRSIVETTAAWAQQVRTRIATITTPTSPQAAA